MNSYNSRSTRTLHVAGAGVPLTTPQLYSGGYTDDIRTALMYISNLYPDAPLLGIGFSLGANILTRYLAQEGERSRLAAGCVLACVSPLHATPLMVADRSASHGISSQTAKGHASP